MHGEYERNVLLRLLLAAERASQRRRGGARALGSRRAALIARVHVALVVVADVEYLLTALGCAGEALEAAVRRGTVARDGDDVDVSPAPALVHMAQAAQERGGVVEQRDVDRHLHASVVAPAYCAAAGHTAGRHAYYRVRPRELQYAPQYQLAAAALAGGDAGRHHVGASSQCFYVTHFPAPLSPS